MIKITGNLIRRSRKQLVNHWEENLTDTIGETLRDEVTCWLEELKMKTKQKWRENVYSSVDFLIRILILNSNWLSLIPRVLISF